MPSLEFHDEVSIVRANQKPPSSARGSWVIHEHSNDSGVKLLALVPGAERSRCGLVLLGHLRRCKRSVDQSGARGENKSESCSLARLNDSPTVG